MNRMERFRGSRNKKIKTWHMVLGALILLGVVLNFTLFSTSQLGSSKSGSSGSFGLEEEAELSEEELAEREFANAGIFGQYNVLLLGIDSRVDRGLEAEIASNRYRTDTIILATLDIDDKKARLISIPRDTRVKIRGGYDKINAAFVYGGIDLAKETVEEFAGVEIDRTVVVDFTSLVKIVDTLGGIEIDVPVRMYRPTEDINLQPGLQTLDGYDALAYSRFRGTSGGDIDRAGRQQEVIEALIGEIVSFRGVTMIPSLYRTMEENMVTDIPMREFVTLGKLAPAVLGNGLDTMVVPGENKVINGIWFWEADQEAFVEMLREE